jgi:hypothetical protein
VLLPRRTLWSAARRRRAAAARRSAPATTRRLHLRVRRQARADRQPAWPQSRARRAASRKAGRRRRERAAVWGGSLGGCAARTERWPAVLDSCAAPRTHPRSHHTPKRRAWTPNENANQLRAWMLAPTQTNALQRARGAARPLGGWHSWQFVSCICGLGASFQRNSHGQF